LSHSNDAYFYKFIYKRGVENCPIQSHPVQICDLEKVMSGAWPLEMQQKANVAQR
jgi:hypothetical protein